MILDNFNDNNLNSIKKSFIKLDKEYMNFCLKKNLKFSGACSVTVLFLDSFFYIFNVGDCWVVGFKDD